MSEPQNTTDALEPNLQPNLQTTVRVKNHVVVNGLEKDPKPDGYRGMKAPQFGTRELLAFIAFVAITIVALQVLDPLVSAGLILLGLCIFAHVAGNAVGMRLRDAGPSPESQTSSALQASDYAPATRLSLHQRLGRMTITFTALGSIFGAIGGGTLLAVLNWENITIANMSLAIISCAILGGFLGFVMSSFLQVFLQAWAEAHRNADPERR